MCCLKHTPFKTGNAIYDSAFGRFLGTPRWVSKAYFIMAICWYNARLFPQFPPHNLIILATIQTTKSPAPRRRNVEGSGTEMIFMIMPIPSRSANHFYKLITYVLYLELFRLSTPLYLPSFPLSGDTPIVVHPSERRNFFT